MADLNPSSTSSTEMQFNEDIKKEDTDDDMPELMSPEKDENKDTTSNNDGICDRDNNSAENDGNDGNNDDGDNDSDEDNDNEEPITIPDGKKEIGKTEDKNTSNKNTNLKCIAAVEIRDAATEYEAAKGHVDQLIATAHNPSLVIPDESPNGNTVYHIYDDGKITYQKGGFAYMQRSEFIDTESIEEKNITHINGLKIMLTNVLTFPKKINTDGPKYSIVSRENAVIIREAMINFIRARRKKISEFFALDSTENNDSDSEEEYTEYAE